MEDNRCKPPPRERNFPPDDISSFFQILTLTWKVNLQKSVPPGAEVVNSWTIPVGSLGSVISSLSPENVHSDPSQITVVTRGSGPPPGIGFAIYVLYRKPIHVAPAAAPESTPNGKK
jgi:hypothetical protein